MSELRSRFGLAVDGLVALAMAAAAGCAGSTVDAANTSSSGGLNDGGVVAADAGPFVPFAEEATFECNAPFPAPITGLKPATPVDYLELRAASEPAGDPDASAPIPGEPSTGTPCTGKACRDDLSTAKAEGWIPESGCRMAPTYQFLVYSRGDTAGAVGKADLATFLAPVENLEEARMLLLANKGISLTCDTARGKSGWRKNADGSFEIIASYGMCPQGRGRFKIDTNGTVTLLEEQRGAENCNCGRRFEGLASIGHGGAGRDLGAYLAEMAYLEAASVIAFRVLEAELGRLGAPRALIARVRSSRADEISHARTTARLATKHGGEVVPVAPAPERLRSVFDIALENAVEGCVRETYGAVIAAYQARNAENPELRSAMETIAVDEAKHAELAHDIAAWLERLLTAEERARIETAKEEARLELEAAAEIAPADEVRWAAGLPGPIGARALVHGLTALARAA